VVPAGGPVLVLDAEGLRALRVLTARLLRNAGESGGGGGPVMGPVVQACRIRDWGLWEALDSGPRLMLDMLASLDA
jgi:hypothetical protein